MSGGGRSGWPHPLAAATVIATACQRTAPYHVYVTNERSGDLTVIDGATDEVVGSIALGKRPLRARAEARHGTSSSALYQRAHIDQFSWTQEFHVSVRRHQSGSMIEGAGVRC
jgi:YVTN family beta-propeller protein